MKNIKKTLRLCALILFMLLAAAGIGILWIAPPLNRDRKLFPDTECRVERAEENINIPSIDKPDL
jgi:hypothetical protein